MNMGLEWNNRWKFSSILSNVGFESTNWGFQAFSWREFNCGGISTEFIGRSEITFYVSVSRSSVRRIQSKKCWGKKNTFELSGTAAPEWVKDRRSLSWFEKPERKSFSRKWCSMVSAEVSGRSEVFKANRTQSNLVKENHRAAIKIWTVIFQT